MRLGDPASDRQAEAGALRVTKPNEPLEHSALVIQRNAVAIVGDPQRHVVARSFQSRRDVTASARVSDGVVEEIPHHLSQQRVVTGEANLLVSTGHDGDPPLLRKDTQCPSGFGEQVVQVQELGSKRDAMRLRAGQEKHGIDQARQTSRLLADDGQRLTVLLVRSDVLRQRHLSRGSYDRHGGSQLVRRVGHELPLEVQSSGKTVEEFVERCREIAEFIIDWWSA